MNSYAATLFSGTHHFGAAALINSLCMNGFRGEIIVGVQGELPDWLEKRAFGCPIPLTPTVSLSAIHVSNSDHLTNQKPTFVKSLLAKDPGSHIFYFDADVVVETDWQFFEKWLTYGVPVCGHAYEYPETHPFRKEWSEMASGLGVSINRTPRDYLNAGFFGVTNALIGFVDIWERFNQMLPQYGFKLTGFIDQHDASYAWKMGDQAAMNLAAMCFDGPLSVMGGESMGFRRQGFAMTHFTGSYKPWNRQFLARAVRGLPPTFAVNRWLNYLDGPIKPFDPSEVIRMRKQALWASRLGRFYRDQAWNYFPPS